MFPQRHGHRSKVFRALCADITKSVGRKPRFDANVLSPRDITIVSMLAVRTLKLTLFGEFCMTFKCRAVIFTNYSLSLPCHLCKFHPVTEGIYADGKDIKRQWDY